MNAKFKSSLAIPAVSIPAVKDKSFVGTLCVVAAGLVALAALLLAGCADPSRAHAVNSLQARDALKIALDEWKRGATPKSLESSSTPMVVQDFEWASGAKLVDYELLSEGKAEDANLRIQVKLNLSDGPAAGKPQSKAAEKKVWYLVGTSPKVTVFRDMLRK